MQMTFIFVLYEISKVTIVFPDVSKSLECVIDYQPFACQSELSGVPDLKTIFPCCQ